MGTVETFDHTADVGLRVRAEGLDDLFVTAAEGMADYIVVNRSDVREEIVDKLSLRSSTTADLLVSWLNELIFLGETRHRVFRRFDVKVAQDGHSLEAVVRGEAIDRDRHVLDHEVKAVTHHGLTLDRHGSEWTAEFILDI